MRWFEGVNKNVNAGGLDSIARLSTDIGGKRSGFQVCIVLTRRCGWESWHGGTSGALALTKVPMRTQEVEVLREHRRATESVRDFS